MSARQYKRKLELLVGDAKGDAIDLSELRVSFQIRRGDWQTPNAADVRIYNLNKDTQGQLEGNSSMKISRVAIQGGYEGNFGLLFLGEIKMLRVGRESQLDSYVDITAADGDAAYNFATIAGTIDKGGGSPANQLESFLTILKDYGISRGYVPELSKNAPVRPPVHFGMLRDELQDFAEQNSLTWSIQDAHLQFVPLNSYIPGEPILIAPNTGLIGVPEQTPGGIEIRVLLNPSIKIGQLVRLDSVINRYRYGLDFLSEAQRRTLDMQIKPSADGLYYVMRADHTGDTRGQEWYTDLTCLAIDATVIGEGATSPATSAIAPASAISRK